MKVWKLLEERGIVDWIRLREVHSDEEGPYLSGMFGVPKAGRFCASGAVVLRVIMNLRPVNRILQVIKGDISELPNAAAWTQLVVDGDEIVEISQADMAAAFYLFALPQRWKKFFGFNAKYTSAELQKAGDEIWVPCCKVLPMGWASSVGLMRMASRQMILRLGSGHGEELRKGKQTPKWFTDSLRQEGERCWWQVYLDNYMAGSIEKKDNKGKKSESMHAEAVGAWSENGVVSAKDKHVIAATTATELGVRIDSDAGLIGAGPERILKLIAVTVILLGHRAPRAKWVQIVLGRWIFILQYRRPAMAVLSQSWRYIQAGQDRRRWWPAVRRELCTLLCLVPLLQSDMKQHFSSQVTCSDASEYGGAIAVSEVLTPAGCSLLGRLSSNLAEPEEASLLVISIFNGIGGGFRGYDLAGVLPHALISIEIDKAAQRVCRKAWPRAIEIKDVKEVTKAMIKQWANLFPRVTHVHLLAGFPCVHLSAVRANRMNLAGAGSNLFWDLKRIIDEVEEIFGSFAEVEFMVENVLSMDTDARAEISRVLGVEPIAMCPSDVLPYNRPRLAWVSKEIRNTAGTWMEQCKGYVRLWMSADAVPDESWIDPGWERCSSDECLPTFMKAIARSKPPEKPAGLNRCSEQAIARWQSDRFKFPPYQYEQKCLLRNSQGDLRYPNSGEREKLMGFGADHTLFALSAGKAKADMEAYEDKRLSLVGDSFSMLSFGWIISQLCSPWQTPMSPQQILDRLGLAPGSSLAAGMKAPMQRGLCYGITSAVPPFPAQLVAQLSRHVDHTGADVCLAAGAPFGVEIQHPHKLT